MFKLKKYTDNSSTFFKRTIIVIIFFLTLIIAPSALITMIPNIYSIHSEKGEARMEDLQGGVEFDGSLFKLDGEWEFYPNQLLTSEDFSKNNYETKYVTLPHYWSDEKEDYPDIKGEATYRMVFNTDEAVNSAGIYSKYQYGAYRIFINGIEVCDVGGVSENFSEYYVSYVNSFGYITPIEETELEIIVQIQNKSHIDAGFSLPVVLGSSKSVVYYRTFLVAFSGIMAGFLFCLFLYFLIAHLQDRTRTLHLDLTIVMICCLYINLASTEEVLIYHIAPLISGEVLFRLEYITVVIASFFANSRTINKYSNKKFIKPITGSLCILICSAILIMDVMTVSRLRTMAHIISFSLFIISVAVLILALVNNKKNNFNIKTMVVELISVLILCLGIFYSKSGKFLWETFDVFPLFAGLYCFIQIYVLLRYYSEVENNLRQLTRTLESRVEERTAELIELNYQVQSANEAKGAFLARMSHEIRTPMNSIIGMSDLINTDNFDDVQKRYFKDIRTSSHSLLNIINDILDFSKIESHKFEIISAHFNAQSLLDNISSMAEFSAKSKDLQFYSEIDSNIPPVLYGDDVRYKQVITNILSNAIKYTRKGYVKFIAKAEGSWLVAKVEDSGIGIKEEDIPRIFDSFEQMDKVQNHAVVGTGLGLAICKQIINMIGGRIDVESVYGNGSTFTIYFPLVEGDKNQIVEINTTENLLADNAVVLVVDDNSINITVAMGILARHNIIPDSATGGAEAIEMIKKKDYDLIFMDHMMPDMDGVETTEHIREMGGKYEKVPIIALTANAISGTRELLIFKGMNDFVSKPIDRDAMNHVLTKWLPKEKIREGTEAKVPEPEEQFPDWLMPMNFLNYKTAIEKVGGNIKIYEQILRQFCREIYSYIATMEGAIESGDIKIYGITVHGIKSVLRNIGFENLALEAELLEKAAKDGDFDFCADKNSSFNKKLLILAEKINENLPKYKKQAKPQGELSLLMETLEKLNFAATIGDSSSVDEEVSVLEQYDFKDYDKIISEIITLANDMEYEQVSEYCNKIQSKN